MNPIHPDAEPRLKNAKERILSELKRRGEMTNDELIEIGGFRYGGRIHELRKEGHIIHTEAVNHKTGQFIYRYNGYEEPKRDAKELMPDLFDNRPLPTFD